jgi:hypothetical protein
MFGAIFRWRLRLRNAAAERTARRREKGGGAAAPSLPARQTREAVKGVARRVVIVREPDPKVFAEAIFVVREDFANGGVGESELLREARQAAGDYIESTLGGRPRRLTACLKPAAWAAAGAALAALLWLTFRFFGVI